MSFVIRPYHPADLVSLYRICLQTANSGSDASHLFTDPELVGQFYAAPYAVLEPDICFVLKNNGKPCGYIIGTKDSQVFYKRCEQEWFPLLRERYTLPNDSDQSLDAAIIRRIHKGHIVNNDVSGYPAHLHIDLLPEAQGQGLGRTLIETFLNRLIELKIRGVHLEVGKKNEGAIKFYERVGFEQIKEYVHSIAYGKVLID